MAKRRADTELNHDNWDVEDDKSGDGPAVGVFKRASEDELSRRTIKVARRRGADAVTTGGPEGPSVFKNFAGFGSVSRGSTKLPSFDFAGKPSGASPPSEGKMFEATQFKFTAATTKADATTAAPSFNFAFGGGSDSKTESAVQSKSSNGREDSKPEAKSGADASIEGNNKAYLANLRELNTGVLNWIKSHLDKDININLNPVFDDYRKHFDELEKKYRPKFSKGRNSNTIFKPTCETKNGDISPGHKLAPPSTSASVSTSFSFTNSSVKPSAENRSVGFSFGSNDAKAKDAPVFSFASNENKPKEPNLFSFSSGVSNSKDSTFAFGSSDKSNQPSAMPMASAISKAENSMSNSSSSSNSMFTFGSSQLKSKDGSCFSTGPPASSLFSFGSAPPATAVPSFSFGTSTTNSNPVSDDQDETPPKQEVVEVKEDDAFYEKRCKLFYKKDGVFTEKGVGTLFLKPAGDTKKTQLVVRAATNLGNVLLNILLNKSLPTQRMGKNNVLIVCVPNPPVELKADPNTPVTMLIRVKTAEDADELLKQIDEHKGE